MPKHSKREHQRKMKHYSNGLILKEPKLTRLKEDIHKQFSERRKIILEEDKTKGIIDRNHLKEKIEKAQINY